MRELQERQKEIDEKLEQGDRHSNADPVYWGCAMAGEVGELCNLLKKQHRGWEDISLESIAKELADVVIYCLMMANVLDIDLRTEVTAKQEHNLRRWEGKT